MRKELDPETHMRITVLTQGKLADGRDYWAYVEMSPAKFTSFQKAKTQGGFTMQDFGEVVEWGEGAEVPEEVRARMEAENGVRHGLEAALRKGSPQG